MVRQGSDVRYNDRVLDDPGQRGRQPAHRHTGARLMTMEKIPQQQSTVFVVDDDAAVRDGISALLESVGIGVRAFRSTGEFLQIERPDIPSCLLLDVRLPGMSGLDFQTELGKLGIRIPIVFITGYADVPMGVQAIKAGAIEFLCKPFRDQELLDAVTK